MGHNDLIMQPLLPPVRKKKAPKIDIEALLADRDALWQVKLDAERRWREEDEARHVVDLERVREEAEAEGVEQGRQQATRALEERLAGAFAAATEAARQFREQTNQLIEEMAPQAERLAVTIAQKVVADEVRTNPDIVSSVFREVMQELYGRRLVEVRVSPKDLGGLSEHLPEGRAEDLDLVADERVTAGGCLLKIEGGEFDASIETRLEEAVSAVWKRDDATDD